MTARTERVAFLQRRLAAFGFWGAMLFLGSLAVRLGVSVWIGEWTFSPQDLAGHVGASVLLFLLWLVLRRGRYGEWWLQAADLLTMNLLTISLSLMSLGIPLSGRPNTILLLASLIIFGMRATYVPSRARQTLLVQLTSTVWMVLMVLELGARYAAAAPDDSATSLRALMLNTFVWWGFALALNVGATRVIYGLREQIREAEQLGQYTLEGKLGEGGMGVVFRASHALLRRPTAVKLLPPGRSDRTSVERFEREVQRTAALTHPNIVSVFDYGRTPDGIFYYAMEFLDGLDLDALVRRHGPQPAARVVHLVAQVCDGLAAAHEVELIHRDIKPANIFALRGGRCADLVKIVDFGLVKDDSIDGALDLTGDQTITGTPQYLSPEAIKTPGAVDARSDLYAVGAVAYYLLTGEHVFVADTVVEVVGMHLNVAPVAPSARLGAAVPEGLEELVLACLEKDPAMRPASASRLRELLLSLEDIPAWRHEDAVEAWREDSPRATPAPAAARDTMAIDLRGR